MNSAYAGFKTEFHQFVSDLLVVDALKDASLGLSTAEVAECLSTIESDTIDSNGLLSSAVNTLRNLLPDHLREWPCASEFIATLIIPRARAVLCVEGIAD